MTTLSRTLIDDTGCNSDRLCDALRECWNDPCILGRAKRSEPVQHDAELRRQRIATRCTHTFFSAIFRS